MIRKLVLPLTFFTALFIPSLLAGQALPVSKTLEIAPPRVSPWPSVSYYYYGPAVVDLGPLWFAVAWATDFTTSDPHDRDRVFPYIGGLVLDRLARPLSPFVGSTEADEESGNEPPVLARIDNGNGFVMVHCQSRYVGADIWFQRFRRDGQPLDQESRLVGSGDRPDYRVDCNPSVASNGGGQFAIAWTRSDYPQPPPWRPSSSIILQTFLLGEPVTPEIEVLSSVPVENPGAPAVGMDYSGNVVVLYGRPGGGIEGRRYDGNGSPLAGPFLIDATGTSYAIAMDPASGSFVVTWAAPAPAGQVRPLLLRRFTPDGRAAAPAVEVYRSSAFYEPVLASDRFGNLALFWMEGWRPALALFNSFLVPQGPVTVEPPIAHAAPFSYPDRGGMALGDDGRILTVWPGLRGTRKRDSIQGRLWKARKDADLCVFRAGRILCDTAGDGGTAELRLRFGQPGEVPVLADLDGDGRADPCVFRGDRFFCDTAHDGGAAERDSLELPRVPLGAQPLLADMDDEEDGEAEPCFRLGRLWVCQLWNQMIGPHTVAWELGSGTGRALLGDVNGDGYADPCIFRQGQFVCHPWNEQEGRRDRLSFDLRPELNPAGVSTPLLGDMDGDGREDPCIYNAGELVCGIFPPGANRPARLVKRTFGMAGDIPMLGDVDGF